MQHPELVGDIALIPAPAAFGGIGVMGGLPRIARPRPRLAVGCGARIDRQDGRSGRVLKAWGEPARVRIADLSGNARVARPRAHDKIDLALRILNTFLTSCRGRLRRDAQLMALLEVPA